MALLHFPKLVIEAVHHLLGDLQREAWIIAEAACHGGPWDLGQNAFGLCEDARTEGVLRLHDAEKPKYIGGRLFPEPVALAADEITGRTADAAQDDISIPVLLAALHDIFSGGIGADDNGIQQLIRQFTKHILQI